MYVALYTAPLSSVSETLYVPATRLLINTVPCAFLFAFTTRVSVFLSSLSTALTSLSPVISLPSPVVVIFIAASDITTIVYGVSVVGAVSPVSSFVIRRL